MEFQFMQNSEHLKKFSKCGYIYKSPAIDDKHHLMLSCLYCNEIFLQLECFLEHSFIHLTPGDMHAETIEEDRLNVEGSITKTAIKLQCQTEALISGALLHKQEENNGKDPLEEENDGCLDDLPVRIKPENIVDLEVLATIDGNFVRQEDNQVDYDDVDFEPERGSDEDSVNDDDESDGDSDCEDGTVNNAIHGNRGENDHIDDEQDTQEINLKRFSKNRAFIACIIQVYKQQVSLWDTTTTAGSSLTKLQSLKAIAYEINNKFNLSATTNQIDMIIKRLRKRFIHQYRLRWSDCDSDNCNKPLWFYDQLKFIEPHSKCQQLKTNICDELTDEQLLILIKLLKENDCFWNENNIYHTSIVYKQKLLKELVNSYTTIRKSCHFTVNDMRNIIEEIKQIVVDENRQRLVHLESHTTDKYVPQHRLYKDLEFLSSHVGPFRCGQCDKSFMDIYAYKFHVSQHEGTKAFKCMVCHKELTHKKGYVCHLRRHTKECPFKCDLCDKSFPSRKERQRHIIKHGSKPYVCELCANTFYTQHQLTNHMKNHANIRDHVCAQCGKGFTHRGLLRQHLQTHNKTECVCSICNNVYANPRSLRKHYVRVHETSQEATASSHSCQICMITFATTQEAKQHRKEHKQSLAVKRKHVCDICGHDFAYPRNLADHKKTHSNVRDQVCDVCGKAFTNANLLNQHKNVHNGKKFVCKVCGKDYAHYRGLCRHIGKVHKSCMNDLDSVKERERGQGSTQQSL